MSKGQEECKCSMRIKLVGDGCHVCNPEYYASMLEAEPAESAEPVAIVDANDEGYWADILPDRTVQVGQKLYAAPVDQSARIAELEEVLHIAKGHIVEICTVKNAPLPNSIIRRIDVALAKASQ